MRKECDLKIEFGQERTYERKEQVDVTYVIQHLLKEKFLVIIEGKEYFLNFGLGDNDVIAYSWGGQPNLTSYQILEKAFVKGIWFIAE
jgi:hypothetical protein